MSYLRNMTGGIYSRPKSWLTLDVCESLYRKFKERLEYNEPIPDFEKRFEGRLESVLGSVRQTYGGKQLNETIFDAAGAYYNQLVRGHVFRNGNKRMAVLFTDYFLWKHKIAFTLTSEEMYHFAILISVAGERGYKPTETLSWCKNIIEKYTKVVR